jgi:hypothetical protein
MRLEIPFKEVRSFLSEYYNVKIRMRTMGVNTVKISYFGTLLLEILEVENDILIFRYKLNGIVNLLLKVFLKKKIGAFPLEWDMKQKEIRIDLARIPELLEFLKFIYISDIYFIEEGIIIVFFARSKKILPEQITVH